MSAPAAGPDSIIRTGYRSMASAVAIPPEDCMTKSRPR